jgi:hypothetical protein
MADFCGVRTASGCCIVQIFDEAGEQTVEKMADEGGEMSDDLVKRLRRDAEVADRSYPEVFHVSADLAREAADRIKELEREKDRLVAREYAFFLHTKDARREALEEAAREIECGCPDADKVALLPPNGGERWRLCGEANCMAIAAAAIRALKEKE